MKHELDGGGWAEIRPDTDLKGADRTAIDHYVRRKISAAAEKAGSDDGTLTARQCAEMNVIPAELRLRGMLARAVTAWSFGEEVPEIRDGEMLHEDSAEEIPLGALGEIEALLVPHMRRLLRVPDPKDRPPATTSASNGRSSAKALSRPG